MLKRISIIVGCIGFLTLHIQGQTTVVEEYSVTKLVDTFVKYNNEKPVKGYRIVVSLSRDRRNIEEAKQKFYSKYPSQKLKMEFANPHYKLITGAFRDKRDLAIPLKNIRKYFRGATSVVSNVTNKEIFECMQNPYD